MKILAHCEDDSLIVQATSQKLYSIMADYDPLHSVIIRIRVALLEEGETTKEAENHVLEMFDKVSEGKARWGQGSIDITEWYKLMTPKQRTLLYD